MKSFKFIYRTIVTLSVLLMGNVVYGQLNPIGAQYYYNQYISNSSLAGIDSGWRLNTALKTQMESFDQHPTMQSVTIQYGSKTRNVGFGINFYNEGAGLIQRTNIKGTYAYHLKLGENKYIDFGLSGGIMNEWVDISKVHGDNGDLLLANFNQRKTYFDADFGLAYRVGGLTLQGSIPNLKRFFDRDLQRAVADRSIFLTAGSYKINFSNGILNSIEPKIIYRGVQGLANISDFGVNVELLEAKLVASTIYHSTKSTTFGISTSFKKMSILCMYTTNTSELMSYSNGDFEIAFGLRF